MPDNLEIHILRRHAAYKCTKNLSIYLNATLSFQWLAINIELFEIIR